MLQEDRGRDGRDAATSQGTPRTACSHEELEAAGRILPQSLRWERSRTDTVTLDSWPPEL